MRLAPYFASVTVMETLKLSGAGPAHLLVDRAGGYAYFVNYRSGTWTQVRLGEAGQLEGVARHETFPGEARSPRPPGAGVPSEESSSSSG